MSLTFAEVTATNRARCGRWHPGFPEQDDSGWTGADWSNAMQGEAGEAGNVVKKLRRLAAGFADYRPLDHDELHGALAAELADTYLYLDLLATYYGIDLPAAIVAKFNFVSEKQGFPERLEVDKPCTRCGGKGSYSLDGDCSDSTCDAYHPDIVIDPCRACGGRGRV